MLENNNPSDNISSQSHILDAIIGSQTQVSLNNFEPASLVNELLALLKDRDCEILNKRFGLKGSEVETLESIGKRHNLTRERVRQIEKDCMLQLSKKKVPQLDIALQLLFDTIVEHGGIMSEEYLSQTVLGVRTNSADAQALNFLLTLSQQFSYLKESNDYAASWFIVGFNIEKLNELIGLFKQVLETESHAIPQPLFFEKAKNTEYYKKHEAELNDLVLKSYLNVAKNLQTNPFEEIGLKTWSEVRPKDVGDKAYLVLKHHGKPEHYSAITQLINQRKFDGRTAYQETVHNELIKDPRFVLIGRGIYALAQWGYKRGVVADVIKEILKVAGKPLTRDEIISEVLKRRQVKRNTILVGLSNKKYFVKAGKDRYALAETAPNP